MGQAGFIQALPALLMDGIATTVTARQGEFERIAMPHSKGLLRVARRLAHDPTSAEDLVQETLFRAWRNFDQFQTGTNVRAWLFRILFNVFYAQGRHLSAGPILVSLDAPGHILEPQCRSDSSIVDAAVVRSALGDISPEHRTVLLLAVVEGFSCREMAEIMSLPIGTVMSRLSRGRQALRERLTPAAPRVWETRATVGRVEKEVR
jgi:RNA polymerase sigma-70 factor, ECF subfamily